jgi:hypothetical protein
VFHGSKSLHGPDSRAHAGVVSSRSAVCPILCCRIERKNCAEIHPKHSCALLTVTRLSNPYDCWIESYREPFHFSHVKSPGTKQKTIGPTRPLVRNANVSIRSSREPLSNVGRGPLCPKQRPRTESEAISTHCDQTLSHRFV